ncbi:MAG TPA: hypothetical protein VFA83_11940 [Acidimicrobiales bacterium]|nr:hypothetical protein [Acidimicrobiales bacterium]
MFEDLDDPQAPTLPLGLRDSVVRIAAHRRRQRRLVVAAVAAAVVAVPVALVATGTSPIRRFTVSSASEHRATTTTVAGQPSAKPRSGVVGARHATTSTTWNGVLHCDARPLAQRQATDSTLVIAQRFGRWIVTTRRAGDHQTLAVQDCSTNRSRVVPAPPPGRACATYDSLDMGGDVLLYRCRYADDSQVVIANDLTNNTVTPVKESPDRSWRSGSMAPGGAYVVFTGSGPGTSTTTSTDVFVFDLGTKTLDRLPRAFGGQTDRDAESRGISIDGRSVLVSSTAPPTRPGATGELYLFDRLTRSFALVPGPDNMIGTAALSGDGRHVGFEAVPATDQGPAAYAYDAGAAAASFVSLCGEVGSDTDCGVHISEDGSAVTFTAAPCVSVTGTSDRTGGTYTFDRGKGTVHKDADAVDTRDCTPPSS